jgi:hypothetical protein
VKLIHLVAAYLKSELANPDGYRWKINQSRLPDGIIVWGENNYSQNVNLKYALHRAWLVASRERNCERLFSLARYYIVIWGGIKRNKEETIREYVAIKTSQILRTRGINGIASWSKVLCIVDPNNYTIFDARVARALNALQIIAGVKDQEFVRFPTLSSQNKVIKRADRRINQFFKRQGITIVKEFYATYVAILKAAAGKKLKICEVEMRLFSGAEHLSEEAIKRLEP